MTKIIFLDIDGVLNNHASLAEGVEFVNDKCKLIKRIVDETNAKIVISSTWRIGRTIDRLNDMLHVCGGPYKAIIGATPQLPGIRGLEIEEWLKKTVENVERYVIIDDDSDMLDYQKPFFFQTHMYSGLITRDAIKIIKFLNTGERDKPWDHN